MVACAQNGVISYKHYKPIDLSALSSLFSYNQRTCNSRYIHTQHQLHTATHYALYNAAGRLMHITID